MDSTRDRNEIKARKIIDKHAQKVYNYVLYKIASSNTPWPLGRRICCGKLCGFSFYSIAHRIQKSRVVDQKALKAFGLVVFGSSRLLSPLLYSIPPVKDSAHEDYTIASPFWILEMQKCHNKLLSVCNGFFGGKLLQIIVKSPCRCSPSTLAFTRQPCWQ